MWSRCCFIKKQPSFTCRLLFSFLNHVRGEQYDKTDWVLTEIAMMSALAIILSFVQFKGIWAYGGSVSLEIFADFSNGVPQRSIRGVATGLIVGMVKMLIDGTAGIHPASLILDYPLAFLLAGFAGVFRVNAVSSPKRRMSAIVAGILFGSVLRLASHVVSGVIFFAKDTLRKE